MGVATEFTPSRPVSRLLGKLPFLGHLALTTPRVVTDAFPTAATDGETIYFNPEFMSGLSIAEQAFVVAHELLHITLRHTIRRPSDCKTPHKLHCWRIAADHVINLSLIAAGLTMPKKDGKPIGYADSQYAGWCTEQVYRHLLEENPDQGQGDGQGQEPTQGQGNTPTPAMGDDLLPPTLKEGDSTVADVESRVKGRVKNAANIAGKKGKGIGSLPAEVRQLINELFAPVFDWREQLRDYFHELYPTHESWGRLNRRMRALGRRWPSVAQEPTGSVSVVIDISGSVSSHIARFLSELKGIMDEVEPSSIDVRFCNTRVVAHVRTTCEDWQGDMGEYLTSPPAGGGTDLISGIEAADEDDADVIVLFTDGGTPWGDMPATPILTVLLEGGDVPPYGDVAVYSLRQEH